MARTSVRRPTQPRGKRASNGLVIAGIVVVLIFALLGVVSAGAFVAGKVSSSPAATATPRVVVAQNQTARLAIARAQAQATAIVRHAQVAGRAIVSVATTRANKQVKRMLAAAKHQSQATVSSSTPSIAAAVPPTVAPNGAFATTVPTIAQGSVGSGSTGSSGTTSGTTPNLSGLPASWKVVGYNATFGSGPGSAGSITVTNRSGKTFSGYARVTYAQGGYATGYFSGLAPGATEVLSLNGRAYSGGGYSISVVPR